MVQDIFIIVGILLLFLAPFVAIGWIIYRLVTSGKKTNSIVGD